MLALIRTTVVSLTLCGLAIGVFWKVSQDQQARMIEDLQTLNQEMAQRLAARQEMVERLSRTRRVAHLSIEAQQLDPAGAIESTDVLLVELDEDGAELARQRFTLPGDVLTVDAWIVKFEFNDVAQGHPLAGHTLMLLRRVYSDRMRPIDGFPIDTPGAVPPAYAVGEMGHFQQRIWEHFWQIATDPKMAASMGVRVAQGEAVYKPVRVGQTYELSLDAAGGLNLLPLDAEPDES